MSTGKRIEPTGPRRAPPKETRFKPGQSGNPNGRPKKQRGPEKLDPLKQAFQDALIEESNRPVTLNEGGKQVTMPASTAVLRATHLAAIKGSSQAQRTLIHAYLDIEQRAQAAHAQLLGRALDLKITLEENLRKWIASGRDEQDIPIHPSDIEIDAQTLDVRHYAPLTAEGLRARCDLIEFRNELLKAIAFDEFILSQRGENEDLTARITETRSKVASVNARLSPRFRKDQYDWSTMGPKSARKHVSNPPHSTPASAPRSIQDGEPLEGSDCPSGAPGCVA